MDERSLSEPVESLLTRLALPRGARKITTHGTEEAGLLALVASGFGISFMPKSYAVPADGVACAPGG